MKSILAIAISLLFTLTGLAETQVWAMYLDDHLIEDLSPQPEQTGDPFEKVDETYDHKSEIMKDFLVKNPIPDITTTKVYDITELIRTTGAPLKGGYCVYLEKPKILIARASKEDWEIIEQLTTEIGVDPPPTIEATFTLKSTTNDQKSFSVSGLSGDEGTISDKNTQITYLFQTGETDLSIGSLHINITHNDLTTSTRRVVKTNTVTPLASWKNEAQESTELSVKVSATSPVNVISLAPNQELIESFDKQYVKTLK